MAEWLKALVLKTKDRLLSRSVGSNPTPSAYLGMWRNW